MGKSTFKKTSHLAEKYITQRNVHYLLNQIDGEQIYLSKITTITKKHNDL